MKIATTMEGTTTNKICAIAGCCMELHQSKQRKCNTCCYTELLKDEFEKFLEDILSEYSNRMLWKKLSMIQPGLCMFKKFTAITGFIEEMQKKNTNLQTR